MLRNETKDQIIKEILNDLHDIYIELPKDYAYYIIGQAIEKTEKAMLFETGQTISNKVLEIKQKLKLKDADF